MILLPYLSATCWRGVSVSVLFVLRNPFNGQCRTAFRPPTSESGFGEGLRPAEKVGGEWVYFRSQVDSPNIVRRQQKTAENYGRAKIQRVCLNPRPGRGGGSMRPPPPDFFRDVRRAVSRIGLKFCIASRASFAQLLVKKLFGSCQVNEL